MSDALLNNVLNKVEPNSKILFVWSGKNIPESFQQSVEKLQEKSVNKISVEHSERLSLATYDQSSFDLVLSNLLTHELAQHNSETLANYLKLLKPKGFLIAFDKEPSSLESELKLSGFQNIVRDGTSSVLVLSAEKPNFEVGGTRKLKFASKANTTENNETKPKVWQFSANDIQEDDLINTDDLLDETDILKPVVMDKFDCGTSKDGKKKACKNCSCGLAEELENEALGKQKKNQESNFKSACGSCYLGDAFRCASCPYLGMPAFKPGEKVQLNDFNKADI